MADTKNTKTEVGIIGQTYINRKTKKIGTIESRDEKYKTLLMRDNDGKTFNVVYSTFKSDWRKHDDGSVDAKKPDEAKDTKSEVKKESSAKKKMENKQKKIEVIMESFETVKTIIERSKMDLSAKKDSRGGIKIHYKRRTLFEIWVKENSFTIYSPVKIKLSDSSAEYVHIDKDKWILKEKYIVKNLKSSVGEVLEAVKPVVDKMAKEMDEKKAAAEKKAKKSDEKTKK